VSLHRRSSDLRMQIVNDGADFILVPTVRQVREYVGAFIAIVLPLGERFNNLLPFQYTLNAMKRLLRVFRIQPTRNDDGGRAFRLLAFFGHRQDSLFYKSGGSSRLRRWSSVAT